MKQYLILAQIAISIILIALILLQPGESSLGSSFGGSGGFYATRRGIQKKIFWATVISGILFIALALLNLIV